MTKPSFKRPSPALVIAILALFVALGGSAYAAGKIGTKNIKANAITTSKIKKNAITTTKIKNETVTGAKIKESSLGTVPSATNATNAVNATNAANAVNAKNAANFSRYFTSGVKKASIGQTIVLATAGPFTFHGRCTDSGLGAYEAAQFVTTSQPGSNMDSYEDEYSEFDFEPGEEAELGFAPNTDEPYAYNEVYEAEWSVLSADGSTFLQGYAYNGVHALGADCFFNLNWISNT